MPLYVLAACFAVALSIPVMGVAFSAARHDRMVRRNLRVDQRRTGALIMPQPETSLLAGWAEWLATKVRPYTPAAYIDHLDRRISLGGLNHRLTVDRLLAVKVALAVGVLLFALLQAAAGSVSWLFLGVVTSLLVFMIPDLALDSRGQRRQTAIERQLPDVLDQLTISVEAGLGFDGALKRVVDTTEGPLSEEFTRTLQDIQFGMPRTDAIQSLIDRTDVLDLRIFGSALNQASKYGVPLAHVMRVQAADLREKRQFRAEEQAAKVPVKMSMPLVLCILPVLFIVLMGPAVIRLSGTGFGG